MIIRTNGIHNRRPTDSVHFIDTVILFLPLHPVPRVSLSQIEQRLSLLLRVLYSVHLQPRSLASLRPRPVSSRTNFDHLDFLFSSSVEHNIELCLFLNRSSLGNSCARHCSTHHHRSGSLDTELILDSFNELGKLYYGQLANLIDKICDFFSPAMLFLHNFLIRASSSPVRDSKAIE